MNMANTWSPNIMRTHLQSTCTQCNNRCIHTPAEKGDVSEKMSTCFSSLKLTALTPVLLLYDNAEFLRQDM